MNNMIAQQEHDRRLAPHERMGSSCVKRHEFGLLIAALAAGQAALLPAQAVAQQAQGVLEEIVVSARFREEQLQSTPLAITALGGEELNVRSFTDITDLGKTVPNVYIQPSASAFGQGAAISIRGIGQGDFAFSSEPRNGIYIDDVYFGTVFGSVYDLLDLERVEVLRGPQGTLFGRNAMGGAIRMVSRKPEGGEIGEVAVTYGTFDRLELRASYDHTLIEDSLFLRVSGVSKRREGYQKALDFTCEMQRRGTAQLAGLGDGVARLRDPGDNGILEPTDPYLPDNVFPAPAGPYPDDAVRLADGTNRVGTAEDYSALYGINVTADPISAATFAGDDDALSFPARQIDSGLGHPCAFDRYGGQDVQGGRVMLRAVASDNLEFLVTAFYNSDDSSVQANTLIDVGGPNPAGGAPISNPEPGSLIGIPFSLQNWNNRVNMPRWGVPYDSRFVTGDPYTTFATYDDLVLGREYPRKSTAETWGVSNATDWSISPKVDSKFILQYQERKGEFVHDADQSPYVIQLNWNTISSKEWSAELRFNGMALQDRMEWTLGGIYWEADQFNGGRINIDNVVLAGVLPLFRTNDHNDTESKGLYGHVVYDISDRLSASGGVRYTKDDKSFRFDHYFTVEVPAGGESVDWKASLDYRLSDQLFVYAQVATGYTATTFNARPFTPEQLIPFPEEELFSYEAGIKSDLLNDRLRLNATLFYSDYDPRVLGAQSGVDDEGIPTAIPIVSESSLRGVELEINAVPIEGLTLAATAGYLRLSADDIEGGTSGAGLPPWQYGLGAQYEIHLGNNRGTLTPRVDWYYTDKIGFGFDPNTVRDPYDIVNVRLAYETPDGTWTGALSVTNAFDEFYWVNQFDRRARNGGSLEGQPSRPREWAMSLTRRF